MDHPYKFATIPRAYNNVKLYFLVFSAAYFEQVLTYMPIDRMTHVHTYDVFTGAPPTEV